MFDNPNPITLRATKASTVSDKFLSLIVPQFNEVSDAVALPGTPPVLPIGRQCMEFGYCFCWPPNSSPYLNPLAGGNIELEVDACIPYLKSNACPLHGDDAAAPTVVERNTFATVPDILFTAVSAQFPNRHSGVHCPTPRT